MDKMNARKKAARAARLRKQRTRRALLTLCLMLAVAVVSVGGTIAWLTAKTSTITNTFTTSDVDVTINETKEDFKMVPGSTIAKDPKVTVPTTSEDCWLFVKVTESSNLDTYITYAMNDGWTLVEGQTDVYYYNGDITKGEAISILKGDEVTVNGSVTEADMTAANTNKPTLAPTLAFEAYVCQKANVADAKTAWGYITANN